MNLETIKKAALVLAAVWVVLRVLGWIIPAVLSVLGLVIKIIFWAAIALFVWAVAATIMENKKNS